MLKSAAAVVAAAVAMVAGRRARSDSGQRRQDQLHRPVVRLFCLAKIIINLHVHFPDIK